MLPPATKYPFLLLLAAIACSSPTGAGTDGFAEEPFGSIVFYWSPRVGIGAAYRVNPDGSGFEKIPAPSPSTDQPETSRDGSRLVYQVFGDLFVWQPATGARIRVTSDGLHTWPTWSPDGNRVASVHWDDVATQQLTVHEVDGSGAQTISAPVSAAGGSFSQLVFFPRGDSLLFLKHNSEGVGRIWVTYTDGRTEREFTSPFGPVLQVFALSRDGGRFAASGIGERGEPLADGTVVRVALGWNGPFITADFSPSRAFRLSFSPDGKFLVVTLVDPGGRLRLEVLELSTLRRRQITPIGDQGNALYAKWGV